MQPLEITEEETRRDVANLANLRNRIASLVLIANGLLVLAVFLIQKHKEIFSVQYKPYGQCLLLSICCEKTIVIPVFWSYPFHIILHNDLFNVVQCRCLVSYFLLRIMKVQSLIASTFWRILLLDWIKITCNFNRRIWVVKVE